MDDPATQSLKAIRLDKIAHRIGMSIWQLQQLEGSVARFYVLTALATKGMGAQAGQELEESVARNTFGQTIRALMNAGKMPSGLEARFLDLLKQRNWLVHDSLASNRDAMHSDHACEEVIRRVHSIGRESGRLLEAIGESTVTFAHTVHGVSQEEIDRRTREILASWHGASTN